ncbi:hypothetical protein ANN_24722 [Periplaneta americana]|uniref:ISXO2-like transposase domain-containing protein n=1 Tax=Periplaneta americana TaxID=6978 RepID=A0ABQ8RZE3_PERAM|nr:hypothetical protein ANN_24722 [Periplaneta americana]
MVPKSRQANQRKKGEVCVEVLSRQPQTQIGGPGHTVEIDESKFGKRKYNQGKRVEGQWVFGGIDCDTKECFLATVEDRTQDTLLGVLNENVLLGTTIYSDCWKAYKSLSDEGYIHMTVNQLETFKDPETGAHTNIVESMWRCVKGSMPSSPDTLLVFIMCYTSSLQCSRRSPVAAMMFRGGACLEWSEMKCENAREGKVGKESCKVGAVRVEGTGAVRVLEFSQDLD